MFEDLLISRVRMHFCLYDRDFAFYTSKDARINAWLKVAIGTKQSVKKCKERWRSLRNHFVREVQRVEDLGGEHMYTKDKWRHYDAMRFLKPHIHVLRKVFTPQKLAEEAEGTMPGDMEPMKFDDTQDSLASDGNHSYASDFQEESTVSIENLQSHSESKRRKLQHNSTEVTVRRNSSSPIVVNEQPFDFMQVDLLNTADNGEESLGEEDLPISTPTKEVNELEDSHSKKDHCDMNDKLESTLKTVLAVLTQKFPATEEKNPNSGFLSMLDGYLRQLPEDLREGMKMKILNCVYNKIRELKNLKIIK